MIHDWNKIASPRAGCFLFNAKTAFLVRVLDRSRVAPFVL